jgi:tetratricopeptide (TPR) repeat protein
VTYWGESAQKESISGVFDALQVARHGIELREAGELDAAEAIFADLVRKHPDKSFGWQEMGVLQAQRGDSDKALEFFNGAVNAEPHDLLTRSHLVLHLVDMGRLTDAQHVLDQHPISSDQVRRRILAMRDFARYLDDWPKMKGLPYPNHIEINLGFLDAAGVEERIFDAIHNELPFSLLRLGDGEGAWMNLGPNDETDYPHLYEYNRREMLRIWFGNDNLYDDAGFQNLRTGLMQAIERCDILGVPYSLRLNREYTLKSVRGVPSCLNILKYYVDNMASGPTTCCSHDIHVELQDSGFFTRLFGSQAPLGTITCHAELPHKMAMEVSAKITQAYLIPEEKGFADILGANGISDAHFPNVFNRILSDLEAQSQKGMVWLVAAGYLGKLYCGAIREMGGIALDVGSLADGWCEKITRPPLRNKERFALART